MAKESKNPLSSLLGKASKLNKLFKTTNPRARLSLEPGVYAGVILKLEPTKIGKADQEQHPAIRVSVMTLCDKEGDREVWGRQFQMLFMFKDSQNQTFEESFGRFVYFCQESLGLDTSEMTIESLANGDDLDEMNKHCAENFPVIQFAVTENDAGQRNANSNGLLSPEGMENMGLTMKEIKKQVATPADDGDDEPKAKKKKKAAVVEEDDDDDTPPPPKKKKAAVVEEDDEDDDEDDEDDAPPPKKKAKAKAIVEDDDDEDEDDDDEPKAKKSKAKSTPKRGFDDDDDEDEDD
jgi:hypothetical protein